MKYLLLLIISFCLFTPVFAMARVCDVKAYGAKGDGKTKDTLAIQSAIDACAAGGGTVDLHDGVFLTGMIRLRSQIELKVESSATLKGTQDDADYPDLFPPTTNSQLSNCRKALIYAEAADPITIDGGGTIDGSGGNPNWKGKEFTRPMALFIALSNHLTVQDITIKDSGMWSLVSFETDNVHINKVTVNSPNGPTRDGIDIVDGHHVLIENSSVFSEDDAICLKSGSARGVDDVTVKNCHVLQSSVANGLKLGTASTGSFTNVHFADIDVHNVDKAAMAVESVDGADIDGVDFQNIQVQNAGAAVFVLLGQRGTLAKMGSIQNISFSAVNATVKHSWGSAISGTIVDGKTYSPQNISLTNVLVKNLVSVPTIPKVPAEYTGQYPDPNLWGDLPAYGYFLRHVENIKLTNSSTTPWPGDPRPEIFQQDVH